MDTTLTLIDLAGSVALLLWGVHMLQSGIQRAFGPQLRRFLARAIGDRLRAFLAGLGVTGILQSSSGRLRVSAAEGVREAVFAGLGLSIGGSEWMFTPELKSGAVKAVLEDWSLPPGELWAVFPTGRQASAKARAFTMFIERQLSKAVE